MFNVALSYMASMSIALFIVMAIDKKLAIAHRRRISERTLWSIAILGGAIGGWFAMKFIRHKSQKISFRTGFSLLATLELATLYWLYIQQ